MILTSDTYLNLIDSTVKAVSDLQAGDELVGYDLINDIQVIATVSSISAIDASTNTYKWLTNTLKVPSDTAIFVERDGVGQFVYETRTGDRVLFYGVEDLGDKVTTTTAEAYTYGYTGSTLYANWTRENKYAYLAGLFDNRGYVKVQGYGKYGFNMVTPSVIMSDSILGLLKSLYGSVFREDYKAYAGLWEIGTDNFVVASEALLDMAPYTQLLDLSGVTARTESKSAGLKIIDDLTTVSCFEVTLDTDYAVLTREGVYLG